jgi:transposase
MFLAEEAGAHAALILLMQYCRPLRRRQPTLAELARAVTGQDPFHAHLFIFRSQRGDRLKVLQWDRDGYALWYKRLESGVFKLPQIKPGVASVELRLSEFAMLLDGIDMSRVKRMPRYHRNNDEVREGCVLTG